MLLCAVATGLIGRIFGVFELYFLAAALGVAAIAGWLTVSLRRPRVTVRALGPARGAHRRRHRPRRRAGPRQRLVEPVQLATQLRARRGGGRRPHGAHDRGADPRRPRAQRRLPRAHRAARGAAHRSAGGRAPRPARPRPLDQPGRRRRRDPRRPAGVRAGDARARRRRSSAATCSPSRCASARASSTACASTCPATSPARSTGGHRRARTSSRCASTAPRGCAAARSCSTSRCREGADHDEAFERAVVAAASLVHSADRVGLQTRFATTAGVDLRGPTVSVPHVAPPRPGDRRPTPADAARTRPGRGPRPGVRHHAGRHERDVADDGRDRATRPSPGSACSPSRPPAAARLHVDATSSDAMLESWHALVGARPAAVRSTGRRPRRLAPPGGRRMTVIGDRRDRAARPLRCHRHRPRRRRPGRRRQRAVRGRTRPRSRRHRRPARLLDRRRRRVQPGVRRRRLPAATSC